MKKLQLIIISIFLIGLISLIFISVDVKGQLSIYGIIIKNPISQTPEEILFDIPLDQSKIKSIITDREVPRLSDSIIAFQGKEYDVEEFLIINMNIDSENNFTREIRYIFGFSENIDVSETTSSGPLAIKFLGKTVKIINVNNNNFTAYRGGEYFLDSGDSVSVNNKTVKLVRVGSAGAIVVDVDGVTQTIGSGIKEEVNGVAIIVDNVYYDSNNQAASSAEFLMGDIQTYNQGDNYDDHWKWVIGNLSKEGSTQVTENAISGPYVGIVFNDSGKLSEGNCLNLPNDYLKMCIEGMENLKIYSRIFGGEVKTKINDIETFYSKQIPLGSPLTYENGFEKILDNSKVSALKSTTINFQNKPYHVRELLVMGQNDNKVKTETSLTSQEDDYQTDVVLEVDRDAIKYYYIFDNAINLTQVSEENPLELEFLGKTFKIIDIDDETDGKFKLYIEGGVDVYRYLDKNETGIYDGKNLTVKDINDNSILVGVDGTEETISFGKTKAINGLKITNHGISSDNQSVIVIIKQFYPIYKDGDAFIGEDGDNPNWVWNVMGIKNSNSATTPKTDSEFEGPYFGIENDFIYNDDSDNPPKTGECLNLPNNYLGICFYKLNPSGGEDYFSVSYEYPKNLSDLDPSLHSEPVIQIESDVEKGLIIDGIETEAIYLHGEGIPPHLNIFYEDDSHNIKYLKTIIPSDEMVLANINFHNITDEDIILKLNGRLDIPNGLDLIFETLGENIEKASHNLILKLSNPNNAYLEGFGEIPGQAESDELRYGSIKDKPFTNIGTKDEDLRSAYGFIIENPKLHLKTDLLELRMPIDQTKANISIAKKEIFHSPEFISLPQISKYIDEGTTNTISIQTKDAENDPITMQWLLDNKVVSTGNQFIYSPDYNSVGNHNFKVIISDTQLSNEIEFSVNVQDIPKAPTTSQFTGTNFAQISDLKNARNIILEKTSTGKIDFGNIPIDISNNPDLDNNIIIRNDLIAIDTSKLTNFQNKPAKIVIENLNFDETPIIYYNSGFTTNPDLINTICPTNICTNVVYENKVLSFDVAHFSSFFIGEDFQDIDQCSLGIKGNLDLSINEPDDNDKFDIGGKIPVEIKVENNNNEDKDINVEVILYNLDEDEEVKSVDDSGNINHGDSETFNLKVEVPKNLDEKNNYMLYVKAYEDGDEDNQCNEKSIKIKIQREDADLVINNLILTKLENKKAKISIEVENEGKDKVENAYIELKSPQLNLNLRSETFDLNEYDKSKNKISKEFIVEVPENVNAGAYSIEAIINFNNERESRFVSLTVTAEEKEIKESILTISTDSKITDKRANIHLIINNKNNRDITGKLSIRPIGDWFKPMENQFIVLNPETNIIYLSLKMNEINKGSYGAIITIIPEDKSLEAQEGTLIFEISKNIKEKGFFGKITDWFVNLFG